MCVCVCVRVCVCVCVCVCACMWRERQETIILSRSSYHIHDNVHVKYSDNHV